MPLKKALLLIGTCVSMATISAAQAKPATAPSAADAQASAASRLIVLSDIGADPDDTQSFVRLLLYSNEIDLEGLVATTSVWRQAVVSPEMIRHVVDAYAKVQPNLLHHDARYPSADRIAALITEGLPRYGMSGVGPGRDSPGSALIIRALKRDDQRPLWITAWGGVNTLAQALFSLRASERPEELRRLVAKLRVSTISDQDDAGPWIRANFPDLFYVVDPGGDYGQSTWIAINSVVDGISNERIGNAWLARNIQQGHGPLGQVYPDVSWGMEGDTPSWLNLIPNGLNRPEHPDWGGWGGRYQLSRPVEPVEQPATFLDGKPIPQETRPIWTSTSDRYAPPVWPDYGRATRRGEKAFTGNRVTLWRWRDDFQNDFAARMLWTTAAFKDANHAPVLELDRPDVFTVRSGEVFTISAAQSRDPDGDSLSFYWYTYPEAGTLAADLVQGVENGDTVQLTAPKVARPGTIHLIVEARDKGTPALKSYRRVVITVLPK